MTPHVFDVFVNISFQEYNQVYYVIIRTNRLGAHSDSCVVQITVTLLDIFVTILVLDLSIKGNKGSLVGVQFSWFQRL